MTGWGQEEDKRHASQAGYDFHLVKPVDLAAPEGLLSSLDLPGGETVGHARAPGAPPRRPRRSLDLPGGKAVGHARAPGAAPGATRAPSHGPAPGPPSEHKLRA